MGEFTKRVLKPAALPIFAFGFIGVLVFAFSRVLLAVPELGSTGLALIMSVAVILVCGVLAATSKVKPVQRGMLFVVTLGLLGAGGAAGAIGVRPIEGHGVAIPLTAEGIRFVETELVFPAGEKVTLEFENLDPATPHNVSIWADDTFTENIFKGEVFNGVATVEYEIEPLEAGEYAFRCDVHPVDMVGTITAEEGAHPGGGGPAPTTPAEPEDHAEITARGSVFDVSSMLLTADAPTTIEFHNEDAGTFHNVSIYTDESAAEEVFAEAPFAGVKTVEYELPPIEAGQYFFRCDVHTQMNGTVEFR